MPNAMDKRLTDKKDVKREASLSILSPARFISTSKSDEPPQKCS